MTNLTDSPIEALKKVAKLTLKRVQQRHLHPLTLVRQAYRDFAEASDESIIEQVTLGRVQHALAVEHGFANWAALVAAEPMQLRVIITMEHHPTLNDFGMGEFRGGRDSTKEERAAIFAANRKQLRENWRAVAEAVEWLRANIAPIKTINTKHTTYGLKHLIEKETGYISNGVTICAAMIAGYDYKIEYLNPNVWLAMSEKSWKSVAKRHRDAPPVRPPHRAGQGPRWAA